MKVSEWIKKYKERTGCQLCGYQEHPEILEFHHLNRKSLRMDNKGNKVPRKRIGMFQSVKRVRKAISGKCILVCPNCHRLIHKGISPTINS